MVFRKLYNKSIGALRRLSFRTGVIMLAICVVLYILSFAQMALPYSSATKGVVWIILFGLAKLMQYAGLVVVGVEGWRRVKAWFKKEKQDN